MKRAPTRSAEVTADTCTALRQMCHARHEQSDPRPRSEHFSSNRRVDHGKASRTKTTTNVRAGKIEKPIRGRTQQTKPTWQDGSRQVNQRANESRLSEENLEQILQGLWRRVGSPCQRLHGKELKNAQKCRRTSATHQPLFEKHQNPTFPCPRCNRHGREPYHTLTSIAFVLNVNTTC